MTDSYSISYSFQQEPPRRTMAPEALFAVDDFTTCPLAQGTLVVSRSTGNRLAMQPSIVAALEHCRRFLPLEAHARNIVAAMPALQGDTGEALRVLQLVRQGGLLLDARELCARLLSTTGTPRAPAPARVVLLTCDRPAAVARLLDSIRRQADLTRHEAFFLVDDSRDGANARRNRELVAAHNAQVAQPVQYVGATEQDRLLQHLLGELSEHDSGVRFLLARERWRALPSYGLSRTLALLLSVDRRALVADDDVLCEAWCPPQVPPGAAAPESAIAGSAAVDSAPPGLQLSDSLREVIHLPVDTDWRQTLAATGFDPLAGHLQCLGLPLAQVLQQFSVSAADGAVLAGCSAGLFAPLHGDAPVLITQCGSLGDPGTGSNSWMMLQSAVARRATVASAGDVAAAFGSRHCWMGYRRATLTRHAVMSQLTGIDNTALLPPYFPVFRGEDDVFGRMVEYLHPASAALNYAWAVPHLPLAPRHGNREGDSTVVKLSLGLGLSMIADRQPLHTGVAAAYRLKELELLLRELADCPDERLEAECRSRAATAQALAVQRVNDRLAESDGTSPDWDRYLQRELRATLQALQRPLALADVVGADGRVDSAGVAAQIRTYAAGFADALAGWPAMREVARDDLARILS